MTNRLVINKQTKLIMMLWYKLCCYRIIMIMWSKICCLVITWWQRDWSWSRILEWVNGPIVEEWSTNPANNHLPDLNFSPSFHTFFGHRFLSQKNCNLFFGSQNFVIKYEILIHSSINFSITSVTSTIIRT